MPATRTPTPRTILADFDTYGEPAPERYTRRLERARFHTTVYTANYYGTGATRHASGWQELQYQTPEGTWRGHGTRYGSFDTGDQAHIDRLLARYTPPGEAPTPAEEKPIMPATIERSKGHLAFLTGHAGTFEYFLTAAGELYRAPISNVIDCGTGYRIGRWEGPAHLAAQMMRHAYEAFGVECPADPLAPMNEPTPPPEDAPPCNIHNADYQAGCISCDWARPDVLDASLYQPCRDCGTPTVGGCLACGARLCVPCHRTHPHQPGRGTEEPTPPTEEEPAMPAIEPAIEPAPTPDPTLCPACGAEWEGCRCEPEPPAPAIGTVAWAEATLSRAREMLAAWETQLAACPADRLAASAVERHRGNVAAAEGALEDAQRREANAAPCPDCGAQPVLCCCHPAVAWPPVEEAAPGVPVMAGGSEDAPGGTLVPPFYPCGNGRHEGCRPGWVQIDGQRLLCSCECHRPAAPSPVAQLSALCGKPPRPAAPPVPTSQAALLPECQPGARVAADGTVYEQRALLPMGGGSEDADDDGPLCPCGHGSDYHQRGTGACAYIAQQFGPLGLHCACMAYHGPKCPGCDLVESYPGVLCGLCQSERDGFPTEPAPVTCDGCGAAATQLSPDGPSCAACAAPVYCYRQGGSWGTWHIAPAATRLPLCGMRSRLGAVAQWQEPATLTRARVCGSCERSYQRRAPDPAAELAARGLPPMGGGACDFRGYCRARGWTLYKIPSNTPLGTRYQFRLSRPSRGAMYPRDRMYARGVLDAVALMDHAEPATPR